MKRNLLLPMMLLLAGGVFGPSVKAQNWSGATISDAKDKTVYLWNVGAKKFLGKGGSWGTEAVLSNVGTPFRVETSGSGFTLKSVVKGESSSSEGYLGFMNGKNSSHDMGNYYVDRPSADGKTIVYSFDGDEKGYKLKVTSEEAKNDNADFKGDFYLFANMKGNQKAKGVKVVPTDSTAYGQWIIVTEKERKEIFKQAEVSSSTAIPATFLMYDNGFDRNDNDVTYWKTKSSASVTGFDAVLSWENNKEVKPTTEAKPEVTYTYTYTGSHTSYNGSTHNVIYKVTSTTPPSELTDNDKTKTVQCDNKVDKWTCGQRLTVKLDESKTVVNNMYYNGNGYSITETKTEEDEDGNKIGESLAHQQLYGGDWTANIHGSYGVVNQTIPNANMVREGWYKVSCVGFTTATTGTAQLYVSSGTGNELGKYYAVQDLKKISADEAPATYVKASKLINGGGYEASAMVYIDENTENKLKTLSFGIMVDGADETAWTCFDDFQIDYLGMPNTVLVLDEDQTDVEYINKQTTPENQTNEKRTLYLHRTVNANKWNSIVLPVSLTVEQAQSAFGDNFKLSKFEGATNRDIPGRMYFKAVNINRNDKNAVAIEAGQLYIFKPEKEEPTGQKEVEFPKATEITDKLTSYFTFIGVTFNDGRKDFEPKVEGDKGKETYDDGQVQFVGTYVADKDDKQIPANSYVLKGNKGDEAGLWFYRTVPTSTKGFRGWLQKVDPSAKISFSINGVVSDDEATGIDAIDAELNGNAVNGNVYNLSGQLVRRNATSLEGLAKGVYIHNGKKYIVK